MSGNSGIAMMLKSLGIDIVQIQKEYETLLNGIRNGLRNVDDNMASIKRTNDEILANQKIIMAHFQLTSVETPSGDIEIIEPQRRVGRQ